MLRDIAAPRKSPSEFALKAGAAVILHQVCVTADPTTSCAATTVLVRAHWQRPDYCCTNGVSGSEWSYDLKARVSEHTGGQACGCSS